jgi:hypothetical protein
MAIMLPKGSPRLGREKISLCSSALSSPAECDQSRAADGSGDPSDQVPHRPVSEAPGQRVGELVNRGVRGLVSKHQENYPDDESYNTKYLTRFHS